MKEIDYLSQFTKHTCMQTAHMRTLRWCHALSSLSRVYCNRATVPLKPLYIWGNFKSGFLSEWHVWPSHDRALNRAPFNPDCNYSDLFFFVLIKLQPFHSCANFIFFGSESCFFPSAFFKCLYFCLKALWPVHVANVCIPMVFELWNVGVSCSKTAIQNIGRKNTRGEYNS